MPLVTSDKSIGARDPVWIMLPEGAVVSAIDDPSLAKRAKSRISWTNWDTDVWVANWEVSPYCHRVRVLNQNIPGVKSVPSRHLTVMPGTFLCSRGNPAASGIQELARISPSTIDQLLGNGSS